MAGLSCEACAANAPKLYNAAVQLGHFFERRIEHIWWRFSVCFTKIPSLPAKRIELSLCEIDLSSKNLPEILGLT
jgi:hypothetical protein